MDGEPAACGAPQQGRPAPPLAKAGGAIEVTVRLQHAGTGVEGLWWLGWGRGSLRRDRVQVGPGSGVLVGQTGSGAVGFRAQSAHSRLGNVGDLGIGRWCPSAWISLVPPSPLTNPCSPIQYQLRHLSCPPSEHHWPRLVPSSLFPLPSGLPPSGSRDPGCNLLLRLPFWLT